MPERSAAKESSVPDVQERRGLEAHLEKVQAAEERCRPYRLHSGGDRRETDVEVALEDALPAVVYDVAAAA